jgi:hypothetical protein
MLVAVDTIRSSRWRARAQNPPMLPQSLGSGSPLGLPFEGLPSLGMDDVEQTTEPFEGIELGLFVLGQVTGPRFRGELVHKDMIVLGKPQFEKRAGGTGNKFSLKFNDSLPNRRVISRNRCAISHDTHCMLVGGLTQAIRPRLGLGA